MLEVALEAARETGGLVVPTLGAELEAAGYDDDFPSLVRDAGALRSVEPRRRQAVHLAGRFVVAPWACDSTSMASSKGKRSTMR